MKKSELRELVREVIRKVGDEYAVYPKKGGKRLGTHKTRKGAEDQMTAIHISKYSENLDPSYKHDGKSAPFGSGYRPIKKEDVKNLIVGLLQEYKKDKVVTEKDDRCTRIAKRKYDTWPSAYASGAVVRCRRGEIWKGVKEETIDEMNCEHGKYYCNHDKKYKCRKGPKKSR